MRFLLFFLLTFRLSAADSTRPGEITTPFPTLTNLAVEWQIEADFALHNCRIMRNRLTNCFVGISSQPGLGGPNYFLRNVMFNVKSRDLVAKNPERPPFHPFFNEAMSMTKRYFTSLLRSLS